MVDLFDVSLNALTFLAVYFDWIKDSIMTPGYYHLSGRDMDEALLKVYGYKPNDGEVNTVLTHFCNIY